MLIDGPTARVQRALGVLAVLAVLAEETFIRVEEDQDT
jgi:hypothetical protein